MIQRHTKFPSTVVLVNNFSNIFWYTQRETLQKCASSFAIPCFNFENCCVDFCEMLCWGFFLKSLDFPLLVKLGQQEFALKE